MPARGDLALEHLLADRLEGDRRARRAVRRLTDQDSPRQRHGLKPGRGVDEVARDHALVGRAEGHGSLPGQDASSCAEPGSDRTHGIDQLKGGPDAPFCVVLAGRRRPPYRHDRVADELLDRAAIARDDLAGQIEVASQRLANVLAVTVLGVWGESDEVREEDRHETTLGDGDA